jgi:SAM-dependent methyltransferase
MSAMACSAGREAVAPYPWQSTRDLYVFSLRLGLCSLSPRAMRTAAPRLLNPLSYPRGIEFALTLRGLRLPRQGRVLDLASPKLLFLWLASHTALAIHATDILEGFIPPTRHLLERLGLGHEIGERLFLERRDARRLDYAGSSFDAVYSVSVVEHIPDDGDSAALEEIARVLRPGGRACLTVPFRASGYKEEWVASDVFERQRQNRGQRLFFQRRYDDAALERRLLAPSGLRVEEIVYFGEPALPFDRLWNRLPVAARLPFAWAQPFVERALLRELDTARKDRAIGVALTLSKAGGGRRDG